MKVCWNITSRCNKNCSYCFKFTKEDLMLEQNKKLLKSLVDLNVTKISWTGGEPFLYKDLNELLKLSKSYNILNHVNTNASLLTEENLEEKLEFIDCLIISLDFIDDKLNEENGIGKDYYNHIKTILSQIKKIKPSIKIQINTVLFRNNFDYVDELYNEICKFDIDYWKIIRFFPIRGKSIEVKDKLTITDNEFDEIYLKYKNKNQKFKIIIHGHKEMRERHIIVLSSGAIVYSQDNEDIVVEEKLI